LLFDQDGYMTPQQLDVINEGILACFARVRPDAVSLVDAFDFADRHLGSVLGRYDGNVYENLLKWAASSPLNKTQVRIHIAERDVAQLIDRRAVSPKVLDLTPGAITKRYRWLNVKKFIRSRKIISQPQQNPL
jgi:Acyl-CoA oxidase